MRPATPLLPVGRDCDCGHPLVWFHNEQRCAVYGRHRPADEYPLRIVRDMNAPLAWLVDELDAMPMPIDIKRSRAADYRPKESC